MCLSVNPSNSLVSRALLQIQRNLSKSPSAFTQQRPVETAEHGRDSTIQTLFPRPSYPECWGLTNIASGLGGGRCAKVRNRRGLPISEACVHRGKMIDSCWESVTGQRSNQLNYVPNFVFLPLSETRVFSGFPQVQSIRLRRLFQPRRTEFRG